MKLDMTFEQSGSPVNEAMLKRIEQALEFTFPDEVRDFYLTVNGGYPSRTEFTNADDTYTFHQFLPVQGKPASRELGFFEGICRTLRNEDQTIPWHLVPFAVDSADDFYCFSIEPKDMGAIYCFVGEDIESPWGPITRVAGSLREVLENLAEEDFSDEDEYEEDSN